MSTVPTVFNGEMQLMNWGESSANGAWVKFWITPEDLEAFRHLKCKSGKIAGHRVAAVLVEIGDDEKPVRREATPDHGKHYAVLHRAGWFHNPKVWMKFGISEGVGPDMRIECVKEAIYGAFDVDSLKDISPEAFIQWCEELGIRSTLPAAFGGA